MDYIQECTLCAFCEDAFLFDQGDVDLSRNIRYSILQALPYLQILIDIGCIPDNRGVTAHICEGLLLGRRDLIKLGLQQGRIYEVSHLNLFASDFVHIGKSNASVGSAYLH